MRAVVCEAIGQVVVREVPEPDCAEGDVLVRVGAALTCGTDVKMVRRGHAKIPFPVILGHEFAGVVERASESTKFRPGDRVTSAVTGPCGKCPACLAGNENLCVTAFDAPVWGAFAELVRIPARVVRRGLREVPAGVDFEVAALLDPVASVLHALSRLPRGGELTVLVLGSGPIALLFTLLLQRARAGRVLAAGRSGPRLAVLASHGADVIDRMAVNVRASVRELTGGAGADVVIDTTGDPELAPEVLELCARGGTALLFAGMAKGTLLSLDAGRIHYDEVSVIGSFHYTPADADEALALLAAGAVPADSLITSTRPLSEAPEALEAARRGEGMKTALIP